MEKKNLMSNSTNKSKYTLESIKSYEKIELLLYH